MRRVLVTRPEPGASITAAKLLQLGFEPVVLPLTRIVALPLTEWPPPRTFGAAAVTSANAIRHAPAGLLKELAHLPVYAVGETTGEVARKAGLRVAVSQAGDAEHLAQRIAEAAAPGTRILLLCGRLRRDRLEQDLAGAGFGVVPLETYDTVKVPLAEGELHDAVSGAPIDAVLLYSAVAAELFANLATRGPVAPLLESANYFVISERVARVLPKAIAGRAHIAREPTEEAVLSMLEGRG
ncbi:uroporphyrinogen-III synthase [Chelativorans sp.]|uniref:uroporphyrinogen-III synthase n=1 Tax=Chelativorans sp. TaxID=2203393 RepID=UPI002811B65B|nr:uroporphyrinogen-III synthase [Chelativorans sp.]